MANLRTKLMGLLALFAGFILLAADGLSAPPAIPNFQLGGGVASGVYSDTNKNEAKNTTGIQKEIKLKGSWATLTGVYKSYGLEIDSRSYQPQDLDYWGARQELNVGFHYYWKKFPWLAPVLGFHSASQTGDKDHLEAPPAFLYKNSAFVFGLRTSFVPFLIKKRHGLLVQGHVSYLTTLEKTMNFGTDSGFRLGYVYAIGRLHIGIVGGQTSSFFNASYPDEEVDDKYLHVRHKLVSTNYGIFVQY